ncbi:hypothetical protein [Effusibacillus pohliae]|uniref:hypothetical protein n=1 Tax=Effusibacillus pohliae TaxID=232270 RepID=UPI0003700C4D|nr:hypothetical protein [Effusibacillus pohliae]
MVSVQEANGLLGQMVCISCKGNRSYQGMVREVTPHGVLLEMLPGTPPKAKAKCAKMRAVTADKPEKLKGQQVFWLLPFAALFGLRGFRGYGAPHWGYGTPGYGPGSGFGYGAPGYGFGYQPGYGPGVPYRPYGFGNPGFYW